MKKKAFYQKLADILEQPQQAVKDELALQDTGWDSLAVMAVIAAIDETYTVTVPAVELRNCKTAGDIVRLIEAKINEVREREG